jgi:hypothetical protein
MSHNKQTDGTDVRDEKNGVPIWVRQNNSVAFADVPESPGGKMPDFCIIGAAKAGTTALNNILSQHPDIFMNPLKEPHYFSTDAIMSRGKDWYQGLYGTAYPRQLCGEASTSYTRYPLVSGTAERMALANPKMKLIYLMREPVARAESDCLQTLKYCRNVLNIACSERTLDAFLDAVERTDDPRHSAILSTSKYIDQIEAFDAVFPRDQLLFLFQDELKKNTEAVVQRICNFLGLSPMQEIPLNRRANVTADYTQGLERTRKARALQRLPFYETAKRLLPSTVKARVLNLLPSQTQESELRFSDETRMRLRQEFIAPNQRLKERIGFLPDEWTLSSSER